MMANRLGSKGVMAGAVGLIASLMLVFAAGPAFGSETLKWNSCKETPGKGSYEDAACSKALSGGNFSWAALSGETSFNTQGSLHRIKTVQSGVLMQVDCSSASGSGQLADGGAGATVNNYLLTYNNCEVVAPAGKGCKIKSGAIPFKSMAASLKSPTSQEMWFSAQAGEIEPMAEWTMEGCSIAPLNRFYTMRGKYGGTVNNGSSSLYTTRESSEKTLTVMGQKAWIEGEDKIETGSGEALKLGL